MYEPFINIMHQSITAVHPPPPPPSVHLWSIFHHGQSRKPGISQRRDGRPTPADFHLTIIISSSAKTINPGLTTSGEDINEMLTPHNEWSLPQC